MLTTAVTSVAGAIRSPAMGPARVKWNKAIQERIGSVSTMLSQIKGVKMMGLTDHFHKTLHRLRVHELNLSIKFRWILVQLLSLCTYFNDFSVYLKVRAGADATL